MEMRFHDNVCSCYVVYGYIWECLLQSVVAHAGGIFGSFNKHVAGQAVVFDAAIVIEVAL